MSKILVLASKAEDKIIYPNGEIILKRGGPLYFIEDTFRALRVNYSLPPEATPAKVEIKVLPGGIGETGKIVDSDKLTIPKRLICPNVLISTIAQTSLDTSFLNSYKGSVFFDVQGFLRGQRESNFQNSVWETVINSIDRVVLKGNSKELSLIPKVAISLAKRNILIETRGSQGVVVWNQGKRKAFKPPHIVRTENTIGAGDTFFAAFVSYYLLGCPLSKVVTKALDYTCEFMWTKNQATTRI